MKPETHQLMRFHTTVLNSGLTYFHNCFHTIFIAKITDLALANLESIFRNSGKECIFFVVLLLSPPLPPVNMPIGILCKPFFLHRGKVAYVYPADYCLFLKLKIVVHGLNKHMDISISMAISASPLNSLCAQIGTITHRGGCVFQTLLS